MQYYAGGLDNNSAKVDDVGQRYSFMIYKPSGFNDLRREKHLLGTRRLASLISVAMLIAVDLATITGWLVAFIARPTYLGIDVGTASDSGLGHFSRALAYVLPFVGRMFVLLASRNHYSRKSSCLSQIGDFIGASLAFLGVYLIIELCSRNFGELWWGVAGWLTLPFVLFAVRSGVGMLLNAAGLWKSPVVLVSDTQNSAAVANLFHTVAELHADTLRDDVPAKFWRKILNAYNAERLVLALDTAKEVNVRLLRTVVCEGVPFTVLQRPLPLPIVGCSNTSFFSDDTVLTHFHGSGVGVGGQRLKGIVDTIVAALLLVSIAPVMILTGIAIKLDGGPVFFAHERIGMGGRKFRCLKFRSMVVDPAWVLREHFATHPEAQTEWMTTQKLRDDPRITRVGHFLRSTSLDELPQLVNVLRGEMSLVGPRPITEAELARYGEDVTYYLRTRPGLTGLWQVSGRSSISYTRRVELDAWYVRNQNLWHDLVILALTIPAVLKRHGAR